MDPLIIKSGPLFGVAGNPPNFWASNFKSERANAPEWLSNIGLDCFEIQCTYGVRMPESRIKAFLDNSKKFNIKLSIHGPYYIAIGSDNEEQGENSLRELTKSIVLAQQLECSRIVFHLGGVYGSRESSIKRAIERLKRLEDSIDWGEVKLFPEIEGKVSKLGSLEEILRICREVKNAWPCLDFAHHHAREFGALRTKADFIQIFNRVADTLGPEAFENLHMHMYPIEWNSKGEIRHKAFQDSIAPEQQEELFDSMISRDREYLPRYEPLIEIFVENDLSPTVICEASNSQDIGARMMKEHYNNLVRSGT